MPEFFGLGFCDSN